MTPAPPGSLAAASAVQTRPDPITPRAIEVDESHASTPPLHACPHCHTRFLIATGLERHLSTHGHEVQADGQLVRTAKIPKFDTVPGYVEQALPDNRGPFKVLSMPIVFGNGRPQSLSQSSVQGASGWETTVLCFST